LPELLATQADLVLVSAQKYLAAPTAGLILGRKALVRACRAQERGIGRGMKATKEALVGVLAALEERERLDLPAWQAEQARKVAWFVAQVSGLPGIEADAQPDSSGLPFPRVRLQVASTHRFASATALAAALRQGDPSIWVLDQAAAEGYLLLELVALRDDELRDIVDRLATLSAPRG
jgi:seryl-tRNA(Sec) selenium transferase